MGNPKMHPVKDVFIEKPKGILTIKEIQKLNLIQINEDTQVTDESCYSNASYDFRLGQEYYTPKPENKVISISENFLACPYKKDTIEPKTQDCKNDNNVLIIKPFTSIVFSTYEKVQIPDNVAGRFDLMVKWALQGLILQVGTQIEPGYEGLLFGLLHNFSKKEICIPTGSRILTAEFNYTVQNAPPIIKKGVKKNPVLGLQQFLDKYPIIDGSLENYLEEIKRLHRDIKDSIEKTKDETEKIQNAIHEKRNLKDTLRIGFWGILITLILTVPLTIMVPLIVTKATVDKDDYPFQKVYEMEQQNIELKKQVLLLNESLLNLNKKFDSMNKTEQPVGNGGKK